MISAKNENYLVSFSLSLVIPEMTEGHTSSIYDWKKHQTKRREQTSLLDVLEDCMVCTFVGVGSIWC
jgi:hypothetical protein